MACLLMNQRRRRGLYGGRESEAGGPLEASRALIMLARHLDLCRPPITDKINSWDTVELSRRINETMIINPKH